MRGSGDRGRRAPYRVEEGQGPAKFFFIAKAKYFSHGEMQISTHPIDYTVNYCHPSVMDISVHDWSDGVRSEQHKAEAIVMCVMGPVGRKWVRRVIKYLIMLTWAPKPRWWTLSIRSPHVNRSWLNAFYLVLWSYRGNCNVKKYKSCQQDWWIESMVLEGCGCAVLNARLRVSKINWLTWNWAKKRNLIFLVRCQVFEWNISSQKNQSYSLCMDA